MRRKIYAYILAAAMLLTSTDYTVLAAQVHETAEESSEASFEIVEEQNEGGTQTEAEEQIESETQTTTEEGAEETTPVLGEVSDGEVGSDDEEDLEETETNNPNVGINTAAEDETENKCGDNLTWALSGASDSLILTISGTGKMYDYENTKIPWQDYGTNIHTLIMEEGITEIGSLAFYPCDLQGSLAIPNSVTKIGKRAFDRCGKLTGKLIIPENVTEIGEQAFSECSGLTGSLQIPDSVIEIGAGAFYGCEGFTGSLILPKNIETIKEGVFEACRGLAGSLKIPDSVTSIGTAAFNDCVGFTGNLAIPESVVEIGSKAFMGCNGFQGTLTIPDSVETIGFGAFQYCNGFTGSLTIPSKITTIERSTFYGCSGFTGRLTIPGNVTEIGVDAFNGCTGFMGNLTISEGVTTIGQRAFIGCNGLDGIILPKSVSNIAGDAFLNIAASGSSLVIYGISGSYAETYANAHSYMIFIPYNMDGPDNKEEDLEEEDNDYAYAHVFVLDEMGFPIVGAKIETEAVEGDKPNLPETDRKGYVPIIVDKNGEEKTFTITAAGYVPETFTKKMEPDGTYFCPLQDGLSIKAKIGSKTTNLLANKLYLVHTNENIAASASKSEMIITVEDSKKEFTKYSLCQDEKVIEESTDGVFTIPILSAKDTNPLINWEANKKLTVKAESGDGKSTIKHIGICISEDSAEEMPETIDIMESFGFIPSSLVPFLSGTNIEFGLNDSLKLVCEWDEDNHIKIAVNKSKDIDMPTFEENFKKLSNKAEKLGDQFSSAFLGSAPTIGVGSFKTEATVAGFGEGYFDETKKETVIKVGMVVSLKAEASHTQYFFVGWLPVHLTIVASAEVTAEGFTLNIKKPKEEPFYVELGIGSLEVTGALNPKGGVGIQDVADVVVSGKGELKWTHDFGDTNVPNSVELTGSLSLEAALGPYSKEHTFVEKTYQLYPKEDSGSEVSLQSFYDDMAAPLYDSSFYTIMDRSYDDKASIENFALDGAAGENGDFIQSYVYPGAEPKLVTVKDKFYLFWLQDISTRKSEDRAAVVYAVSEDGVNFTAPKQLVSEEENGTLDNALDVFVDGDKIYLCWQDAAESFPAGVSLEEMMQSVQISYAVIDGNSGNVLSYQTVTDEAGCYMQPRIYVKDGKAKVAWVKTVLSGQGGLWSVDNRESLQIYDAESGQISEFSIGSGKEKIVSLDGVVGESQAGVAYILDMDGDIATISDRKVYYDTRLGTTGNQMAVTAQEGQYYSLCAEGGRLYWYAEGNISYTTIGSSAVAQVYEEERADLGSNFKVISEGSKTEIIWNAIELETQRAAIYGIQSLENGGWSSPYILEQTDSEMAGTLSGSLHNGIPYVSYIHIKGETDGSRCYSICVTQKKDITDIALNAAGYDYEQFVPGQTLPIQAQITNKGNTAVNTVNIKMDGNEIGSQEVELGVGETKEITLNQYMVPADIDNYALHTLTITTASESDPLDNDYQIGIGYTDLKVVCSERLFDGNTWLDISVLNHSPIPSGAVLNIRADREDGEILYTEDLGMVGAKKGIFLTVNLQPYESSCCTYFVEVVSSVEDVIEGNNMDFVYTGYGTGIQGGSLLPEPTMYTVSFQSNGGSEVEAVQAVEGRTVREPVMPTREGYRFKGWYLNGTLYDFNTPVREDLTLTAEWEEYTVLAAPAASIESGSTVKKGTKLSLTCAASGAQIYYTLDGTEPTMESACFEEPIELVKDQAIKAFSVKTGYKRSETVTFTYKVKDSEEDPDKPGDDPDQPGDENSEGVLPEDIPADGKIPEGLWIAGVKDVYYTGKAIKPEVRVYDSSNRLTAGQDYTISYKNNTKVNDASKASTAPAVVIKGKGNYKGTETAVFKILPIDLEDENIITEDITAAYNKKVQKKVPAVTYNGKKLTKNKDFIVSYPSQAAEAYKAAGTYDIVLTAKEGGNFTGTRTVKLIITDSVLMSKITVKKIPNQTYTGTEIEPEPVVSFKGTPLVKGRDYTVSYKNHKEIGTATATLTGIGNYAGTKTVTYKITGTPLNKAVVTKAENKTYNGEEQKQNITVTLGGQILREGTDYEVIYSKHKDAGKASIVIKGINAYTGSIKKSFKIIPYDLKENAGDQIGGMEKEISVKYVKGGCKPEIELTFAGKMLTAGKDYTLSYQNNKAVTTTDTRKLPVITIKGKGNFKGTLTKNFTIARKALNDEESPVRLTVADKAVVNKPGKYISKPVLTDSDGKKLTAGKDYECVYALEDGTLLNSKNKVSNAGTKIKITVTGKASYSGTLEGTYQITTQDFGKAKITVSPKVYTGEEILLGKEDITVKFGRDELAYGTDYAIVEGSYINNIKKGTASVTIVGKGNYGGTKTVKFRITVKQFAWFWRIFG